MIWIYRSLYFVLCRLILILRRWLTEDFKKWIDLRQQLDKNLKHFTKASLKKTQHTKTILFHASSGEIEYCKSVIREIHKNHPHIFIAVSYSSPSAQKLFNNIKDHVNAFIPLGWDTTNDCEKIIDTLNPDLIIFSRTDFWPVLLTTAKKKNIKMIAVSVYPRLSKTQPKKWLQTQFLRWQYQFFDFISCVEENLTDELKKRLPQFPIHYVPDTRYDQVFHRLTTTSLIQIDSDLPYVVFASTWPDDEKELFEITKSVIYSGYRIIWAPHSVERSRIQNLSSHLRHYGVSFLSQLKPHHVTLKTDILIIDQVGVLADIYRNSSIAFVGGSFVGKVHSVMEPLCAGNFVLVGPYIQNSPEAQKYLQQGFVRVCQNSDDLLEQFQDISVKDLDDYQQEIKNSLEKNKNGTQTITRAIMERISSEYEK